MPPRPGDRHPRGRGSEHNVKTRGSGGPAAGLGLAPEAIGDGTGRVEGRCGPRHATATAHGAAWVIDDSYNANPQIGSARPSTCWRPD